MRNPIVIGIAIIILVVSFLAYTDTPFLAKGFLAVKNGLSTTVGPVLKGTTRAFGSVGHIFESYFNLISTKKENVDLKKKIEYLEIQNQKMMEMERENARLRNILGFIHQNRGSMVAARVIGEDLKNWYKAIIIDRGTSSGIKAKMPVITGKGIVGQVVESHQWHSKVMVINDTHSAVDVYVDGKETRGILEGTGQATLKLKYVRKTEEIDVGDRLLTSGKDTIYGKGTPVGLVTRVDRDKSGVFAEVGVMPYNDFRKLDEVIIVKK